jgi:hypothetical protein
LSEIPADCYSNDKIVSIRLQMNRFVLLLFGLIVAGTAIYLTLRPHSGQIADVNFDASVVHPAYAGNHPVACFDEGHRNFHTASGTYRPFVKLMSNDGYYIRPTNGQFSTQSLKSCHVLIIANARGTNEANNQSAFTDEEISIVRQWVMQGGSLLLITDHFPFGSAAQDLSQAFAVSMSTGMTVDEQNYDRPSADNSQLVFSLANGSLGDHPILQGRNEEERIKVVVTFTGQSLNIPSKNTALLKLSDTAMDLAPQVRIEKSGSDTRVMVTYGNPHPAAGRAQAVAEQFGKGRVVITGEAGMFTAQIDAKTKKLFGMNVGGNDDRQLALNVMHWLSGIL